MIRDRIEAALSVDLFADRRWFAGRAAGTSAVRLVDAVPLESDDATAATLAIVEAVDEHGQPERYLVPFLVEPGAAVAREARDGDGAWRALAVAMASRRVIRTEMGGALVCRPGLALAAFAPDGALELGQWSERPLGADQSNTSVVLGERLVLKAFRRVVSGLNPDLEMSAYLAEECGLRLVPALAGSAEYVGRDGAVSTLAVLHEWIADAEDAYESIAERLADWIAAPGVVALEYATEDAAALGATLAELHAVLARAGARVPADEAADAGVLAGAGPFADEGAPADAGVLADAGALADFTPRQANAEDLRAWRRDAEASLDRGLGLFADDGETGAELRADSAAIRLRLAILEQPATLPLLTRIHGDLHLGQILRTTAGFVLVDFEGDPLRPMEDRRALASPMRDVATLLRSFDHVSSSAERRAVRRGWNAAEHSGLDIDAWRRRSRERLLAAYRTGLRRAAVGIVVDAGLIDAFEVAKECDELVYAATYLPDWLWAPRAGLARLLGHPARDELGT